MTPLELVNSFMRAAASRDYDTALAMMSEDVVYQNMPLPPVEGRAAVRETLESLLGSTSASEWVVLREVADGDLVMNERIDRFEVDGRWLELPVAGVFEVGNGRIVAWRDYFDLPTITDQLAPPGG